MLSIGEGIVTVTFNRPVVAIDGSPAGFFARLNDVEVILTDSGIDSGNLLLLAGTGSADAGPNVLTYDGGNASFLDVNGDPVPPFSVPLEVV